MARINLKKGNQAKLIDEAVERLDCKLLNLSEFLNINRRTLCDWRNEKYKMRYSALLKLCEFLHRPVPGNIEVLPEYWSTNKAAKIGGKRRVYLYGNPGTVLGRQKGGLISQAKFQKKKDCGNNFKILKPIKYPSFSASFAEFVGILLGDGGISKYQVKITFNRETDREYSLFINRLITNLFALKASIHVNKSEDKGDDIVISSKRLVDFLERTAYKKGDKVKHQVDVPAWVYKKKAFQISCLRGLIDTDGSFYNCSHNGIKKTYKSFVMCFTNESRALLKSCLGMLSAMGFNPIYNGKNRLYLNKRQEIDYYFKIIGTSNQKHLSRYNNFKTQV